VVGQAHAQNRVAGPLRNVLGLVRAAGNRVWRVRLSGGLPAAVRVAGVRGVAGLASTAIGIAPRGAIARLVLGRGRTANKRNDRSFVDIMSSSYLRAARNVPLQ
jgi:hypothetical protein